MRQVKSHLLHTRHSYLALITVETDLSGQLMQNPSSVTDAFVASDSASKWRFDLML